MVKHEVKYALRHKAKDKLLGFFVRHNGYNADGVSQSHYLCDYEENVWYADSPGHAEYVRHVSTPWYNAGYETPGHEYDAEELEVVKLEMTVKTTVEAASIPDKHTYWKLKYGPKGMRPDVNHLASLLEQDRDRKFPPPSWYEMRELLECLASQPVNG